ncbi:D-lactate dehydrogenase cytochrome oxidoreductase [Rhizoctonia solani]|uniref:D-lactate dehydrogenase (cytochrome) n=1 Tax=Rhizoctonia solani TaxID=456999 RepID=A0A8H8NQ78_9AGAM|nr:D-lactate dehydrogenase cytochrome oxidoreductase [Rhizoctonia solani]QRW17884.1 D-lactate dehydrogenase cytochrome oxidoreductase [Rhizoctonia solani]
MNTTLISSAALNVRRQLRPTAQRALTTSRGLATSGPAPRRGFGRGLVLAGTAIVAGSVGYGVAQEPQHDHRSTYRRRITKLPDNYGSEEDFRRGVEELRSHFTENGTFSVNPDVLHEHGFSVNSYHEGAPHSVVISMPVTPYSGGTNLEGGTRGHPRGGICVDMSEMNKIIKINEADSDLVCQAGTPWMEINATLKEKGIPLFFPLDPSPAATIGANAVRYGTAKAEWFLNITVVLPSGEVIKTRRRARKSSAGFDTTKIFIGAEGTLGIITEATIRLTPLLDTSVAVCQFPNVRDATKAVVEIMNKGVPLQCIELCDDDFMRATNKYGQSERKYPEKDSIYFKFQGPPETIKRSAEVAKSIAEKHGGTGFSLAASEQEAADLWADRKNAHYSGLALRPGAKGWATDVCVPISKLPELVYKTKKDIVESGVVSTMVGHVGDGNFHTLLLFENDRELELVKGIVHRMVERAIALDGTCTGEHGVGVGKKKYLYEELGEGTVELMKTIKMTIDPLNIMNPGKLYPDHPDQSDY